MGRDFEGLLGSEVIFLCGININNYSEKSKSQEAHGDSLEI